MPGFVADASATLPWCFEEEATPATEALLERLRAGEPAVVPAHWPTEVMNGLIMAVRRGREPAARRFLEFFAVNVRTRSGIRRRSTIPASCPCMLPLLFFQPRQNDSSDSIMRHEIAIIVRPCICLSFPGVTGSILRSVNRRRRASAIVSLSCVPHAVSYWATVKFEASSVCFGSLLRAFTFITLLTNVQ